jgi:hypothetical protein
MTVGVIFKQHIIANTTSRSRRVIFFARGIFIVVALERAWERRALDAPAARSAEKKPTRTVTTDTPEQPGAPHAMVYSCFVISPVIGLC